jgi:hypothetical protein
MEFSNFVVPFVIKKSTLLFAVNISFQRFEAYSFAL